ncbi:arylsulfatase b [Plakobranchus ocellatus]|uniref:Arylsulfatase b n=1 Tax=Plakobranchus ocellatus TaxID=259542 RepID=A0AAV4AZY3_9GAST|nr:arylsulfatase b [Plakobranchus ocellatus]
MNCQAKSCLQLAVIWHISLLMLLPVLVSSVAVRDPRPNIVFVLADDYGYYDIGYHGKQIKTPHLDDLCSSGVRLENYYVQPICVPTRSQLMSGMYQIHTGLQHSNTPLLPLNIPTVADKIKEAGYSTHMVGKWHLGFRRKENMPSYRGFDTMFCFLDGHESYYEHARSYRGKGPYLDLRTEKGPAFNYSGIYSANMYTERAINMLKNHASSQPDTPLFLYLAYQSVHTPLQVPDHYMKNYKHIKDINRRKYAGMVAALDEGVGNLTEALKSLGMWDNTVFIFSSDNGGHNRNGGASNWPLRGKKGTLWEGGMRANGFVTGGRVERSGVISNELIHVSDWFPTLVGLAKGNLNGTKLDGYDQWNTINKGTASPREVILHNIDILRPRLGQPIFNSTFDSSIRAAIRVGDYKLITGDCGDDEWVPPPGVRERSLHSVNAAHLLETRNNRGINMANGNSKSFARAQKKIERGSQHIREGKKNVWLFNIREDPTEHHDLSDKEPERVRQMLDHLLVFNKTAVPPIKLHRDPRSNPALHGNVWGPWLD